MLEDPWLMLEWAIGRWPESWTARELHLCRRWRAQGILAVFEQIDTSFALSSTDLVKEPRRLCWGVEHGRIMNRCRRVCRQRTLLQYDAGTAQGGDSWLLGRLKVRYTSRRAWRGIRSAHGVCERLSSLCQLCSWVFDGNLAGDRAWKTMMRGLAHPTTHL